MKRLSETLVIAFPIDVNRGVGLAVGLLLMWCMLLSVPLYGQALEVVWKQHIMSAEGGSCTSLALDSEGNTLVTGTFAGRIRFGTTTLTSAYDWDFFVAKHDADGHLLWIQHAKANHLSVAVDRRDNIVVGGGFVGTTVLDTTVLHSRALGDILLAKYDRGGRLLWVTQIGGVGYENVGDLAVDGAGNILIHGGFTRTITIGDDTLRSAGTGDIFVAKYDPGGQALWARRAGGGQVDSGVAIAVDSRGNAFVAGMFQGFASFGADTLHSSSPETDDLFVAKYSAGGTLRWVQQGGGQGIDIPSSLAIDAAGDIVVTGSFGGRTGDTAVFGDTVLTSVSGSDVFVVKYTTAGRVRWARRAGDRRRDLATGLAVDEAVYVGVDYDDERIAVPDDSVRTPADKQGAFVVKYDAQGQERWEIPVDHPPGARSRITSLTTDATGTLLVLNTFWEAITFSPHWSATWMGTGCELMKVATP